MRRAEHIIMYLSRTNTILIWLIEWRRETLKEDQEDESGWRQESLGTYCWPRRCEPVTTVLRPQPPFSLFGIKGRKEVIWQVTFCPGDVPFKNDQHVTNRSPVKFICNFIYANTQLDTQLHLYTPTDIQANVILWSSCTYTNWPISLKLILNDG